MFWVWNGNSGKQKITDAIYPILQSQNVNIEKAKQGITFHFDNIPPGSYAQFNFNVGLTAEQNKAKPTQFAFGSPFSYSDRYWSGWNSYIFYKIEGSFLKSNAGAAPEPLVFHAGVNENTRSVSLPISITLIEGDNKIIHVNLDHKLIFGTQSNHIDFTNLNNIQNPGPDMKKCVDLFAQAFSIQ